MTDHHDDDEGTAAPAEVVREYGPFPGVARVHGVSYDGANVWFAATDRLHALDPVSGELVRALDVPADAGTAFDGQHLFQIADGQIHKIDPATGQILATVAAPTPNCAGMAWADGSLWVAQYDARRIHQIDPETGQILRTIESNRYVTGVTWVDGELWHGATEDGAAEVRRIDPASGRVRTRLEMPAGERVSGLESDGRDLLFCGGDRRGTIRAVRRPRR